MDPKKKLMYIHDEDYYYFLYNILIILFELNCFTAKSEFRDIRKLAVIIELVNNKLCKNIILKSFNKEYNTQSKSDLFWLNILLDSRAKVKMSTPNIHKIIIAMQKNGLLTLIKNSKDKTIDVFLSNKTVVSDLISDANFDEEIKTIKLLKKYKNRIRTVSINNLETSIYGSLEG